MNKNFSRIYILIIIIIYAHTKYKNMLITLGYILYMSRISDNPRQYIYFNTSCKPTLRMEKIGDLFFFFKLKMKIINEAYKG